MDIVFKLFQKILKLIILIFLKIELKKIFMFNYLDKKKYLLMKLFNLLIFVKV